MNLSQQMNIELIRVSVQGLRLSVTHPFDKDFSSELQDKAPLCQDLACGLRYLDASADTCAVHAAGQVHCGPPDVILRLSGTDDTRHHGPMSDACLSPAKTILYTGSTIVGVLENGA